ncbi:hypothetical protein TWF106_002281 [Orbilia oligospora]|uniref:Uncharacterized protein n=1 Tax=Orbilia oligospora TaxID=2813651 RepID=A0A7C8Q961_ORBOL|nr:hypothetical protein TWF106_002281 [Orbilia oligospora]
MMGEDDDLAKRFESIFSKKPVANSGWDKPAALDKTSYNADSSWQATEEASLEDLLEELGAEDTSWIEEAKSLSIEGRQTGKLNNDDSNAVNKLLAEAKERLKVQDRKEESDKQKTLLESSTKTHEHDEDKTANSDDEADVILRQIQDSLSLEDTVEDKEGSKSAAHNVSSPGSGDGDDADDELAKRFAALDQLNLPPPPKDLPLSSLNLPGVPKSQPGVKGKKTITQKVDDLVDDIENWCCICNEDAVVKCLGCDGDLYCTECFNEGHRGKDAPYDMKRHKALAYNKKKPMAA